MTSSVIANARIRDVRAMLGDAIATNLAMPGLALKLGFGVTLRARGAVAPCWCAGW